MKAGELEALKRIFDGVISFVDWIVSGYRLRTIFLTVWFMPTTTWFWAIRFRSFGICRIKHLGTWLQQGFWAG